MKNYYTSPKRGRVVSKQKKVSSSERPPWHFDRKEEEEEELDRGDFPRGDNISTVSLPFVDGQKSPPTFTTVSKPAKVPTNKKTSSSRQPVLSPVKSRSLPSLQRPGGDRKKLQPPPPPPATLKKKNSIVINSSRYNNNDDLTESKENNSRNINTRRQQQQQEHNNNNNNEIKKNKNNNSYNNSISNNNNKNNKQQNNFSREEYDQEEDVVVSRSQKLPYSRSSPAKVNSSSKPPKRSASAEDDRTTNRRRPLPHEEEKRIAAATILRPEKGQPPAAARLTQKNGRPERTLGPSLSNESTSSSLSVKAYSHPPSRAALHSPGEFTSLAGVKSATASIGSHTSNFQHRTKVITFNDRKCSLGSIGEAQITHLTNQLKVRTFPNGPAEGLVRAVTLLQSSVWEKEVEGLELLASLAQQSPEFTAGEVGKVDRLLLTQLKNLRSQVCRAACQCAGAVFLHLGRSVEPDLEKLLKELLQKSADTNKFIRSDANLALDVMAENVSVCRAVTAVYLLGRDSKNAVIRTNIARIMDSVITRLGAERFMGSSDELQECVVRGGAKLLVDGSLDVRQHAKHMWSELNQHGNTGKLVERLLVNPELRDIQKILDNLH